MNQSLLFTCILLLLFVSSGKSQYKNADEIQAGRSLLKYKTVGKGNYRINVPVGWTAEYTPAGGINLWAPKAKDDANTNINVLTDSMYGLKVWDYREKLIDNLKRTSGGVVTIMQRGDINVNGREGCWYRYIFDSAHLELERKSYIIPQNNTAYIITCNVPLKNVITHLYTFDSVARSIRIIK
jgi:hypothetical protein